MKFKSGKKDKKSKENNPKKEDPPVNKTGTLTRLMGKLAKRNSQSAAVTPLEDDSVALSPINMETIAPPPSAVSADTHLANTLASPSPMKKSDADQGDKNIKDDDMPNFSGGLIEEEDNSPILALNEQFELINEYDDSENGDDNARSIELFTSSTGSGKPVSRVITQENDLAKISMSAMAEEFGDAAVKSGLAKISLAALTNEFGVAPNADNDLAKLSLSAVTADFGRALPAIDNDLAKLSLSAINGEFGRALPAIDNDLAKLSLSAVTADFGRALPAIDNDLAKLSLSAINGEFGDASAPTIENDISRLSMSAVNADFGRVMYEEEISRISLRSCDKQKKNSVSSDKSATASVISKTNAVKPGSANANPLKLPTNVMNHANSINSMASFNSLSSFEEKKFMDKIGYNSLVRQVGAATNSTVKPQAQSTTAPAATHTPSPLATAAPAAVSSAPVPKPRRLSNDSKLGTKDTQALASVDVKSRINRFSEEQPVAEANTPSQQSRQASVSEQTAVPSPAPRKQSAASTVVPIPAGPSILQRKQSLRVTDVMQQQEQHSHAPYTPVPASSGNSSEADALDGLQRRPSVKKYEVNVPPALNLQRRISISKADKPEDLGKQIMNFDAPSTVPRRPSTFSLLQRTVEYYEESKKTKGSPILAAKRPSTSPDSATAPTAAAVVATAAVSISTTLAQEQPAKNSPASQIKPSAEQAPAAAAPVIFSQKPQLNSNTIAAMAKAESVPVVSKLLRQLQSDDNKTAEKNSIKEISKAKIVSHVSSFFEQKAPSASESPSTVPRRVLNLASLAAAAPVKVVDKAKIFTAGSTSSSSITHIDAAAAIAKAGAAGKVAKFSEIFESKAQATAPTTIGSGNYTTGSSTSDAAIPRSLGRSPSVSRHPVVTSRPVILTRGPAKAI